MFKAYISDQLANREICILFHFAEEIGAAHVHGICQLRDAELLIGDIFLHRDCELAYKIIFGWRVHVGESEQFFGSANLPKNHICIIVYIDASIFTLFSANVMVL